MCSEVDMLFRTQAILPDMALYAGGFDDLVGNAAIIHEAGNLVLAPKFALRSHVIAKSALWDSCDTQGAQYPTVDEVFIVDILLDH